MKKTLVYKEKSHLLEVEITYQHNNQPEQFKNHDH